MCWWRLWCWLARELNWLSTYAYLDDCDEATFVAGTKLSVQMRSNYFRFRVRLRLFSNLTLSLFLYLYLSIYPSFSFLMPAVSITTLITNERWPFCLQANCCGYNNTAEQAFNSNSYSPTIWSNRSFALSSTT